ncbi:hypothetical protein [Paenibacillus apiarius]|uniref:hypothetical protein n=1 Tax=Paenibacillus apiarius TaxID=46240 RepID=UPI0019802BF2|nr:hypothetical protein [Paenibacillus apiarius]MBN3526389.1 hypothetical protein [Paenibacillus apiarius]
MKRLHLFEFMDYDWFPKMLRDLITDVLQEMVTKSQLFDGIIPIIQKVMQKANTNQIIDLCSGGGGPWLRLIEHLQHEDKSVKLILTDKYPNKEITGRITSEYKGKADYLSIPVDAAKVTPELKGVRTLIGGFHHMKPPIARAILADAAEQRVGIGVFETMSMSRRMKWLTLPIQILFSPLLLIYLWVISAKAMRGSLPTVSARLFFTYLFPVAPLVMMFEAFVSGVRIYTKEELEEMTASLQIKGYTWEVGMSRAQKNLPPIIYLIGYPE